MVSGKTNKSRQTGRGRSLILSTIVATTMLCAVLAAGVVQREVERLGPLSLQSTSDTSISVVDRKGRLLRAFTTEDGRWRLPAKHTTVDRQYLELLLAFEDKRFFAHGGVDWLALLRASTQFMVNGRVVSGGSTLTMQVARLVEGRHERTGLGKLRQIIRAIQIENRLAKHEILDLYLKLAPFGGNIEGVRAASLAYFGKEPQRLSLGQSALLVALPQSPEIRRPDRFPENARRARARVLSRARSAGLITVAEEFRAGRELIPKQRRAFPKLAAHLTEQEFKDRSSKKPILRTTLDRSMQERLERLVARHTENLGARLSAALIVVDNASGEVRARIGSAGYFDGRRFGAVDMTRAVRSPGSALKPIVYGLAFDLGIAHPETLIDDRPVRFGVYAPKNFDKDYRGTVTIREALAKSLNIPAVKVLDAIGPGRLVGRLTKAGIVTTLPDGAEPSLAIALGGIGIRLEDMARVYTALARGGRPIAIHHRVLAPQRRLSKTQPKALMSRAAAYYITSILKDSPPPDSAKKGQIAFKTGTSYGHRDAWAAGYDGSHTVVAWVGRPDAAATPGLTGRTAAAPLLFDAFQIVSAKRSPFLPAPRTALRRTGAQLPEPLKRFERERGNRQAGAYLARPVRIAFPPDRSEVELPDEEAVIVLKASGGALPLTWFADGAPIKYDGRSRQFLWRGARSGFVSLTVVDANGLTDRISVRLRSNNH